jgi:hypothetical protein
VRLGTRWILAAVFLAQTLGTGELQLLGVIGNSRRLRGALRPLLEAAPLSKSAVSRVVATLKAEVDAWRTRPLTDLDVLGLYLDAVPCGSGAPGKS